MARSESGARIFVMSEKPVVARRRILVDRTFQLSFLRLWLVVGLGLVVVSAGFYLVARHFLGSKQFDPLIVRVFLGMGVFILLFCVLMGTLSVALAHRVAGAAYRLEKALDRLIEGDFSESIALRKGDYLTQIAERLTKVQEQLRRNRKEAEEIVRVLTLLRSRTPASDQPELERLIQSTKSTFSV